MGYTTEFEGEFACRRREGEHAEAFLKAIEDGDRAALAPLADWLTDHDDPRGEAVARLARKPPKSLNRVWVLFGLRPEHAAYLQAFSRSRRMRRDARKTKGLPDPLRLAVGLPVGPEGGYFIGAADFSQEEHDAIRDYNAPPKGQPGLWCQWLPNKDGTAIVWDGGEKFYCYLEWLEYLIQHFLGPWGYVLNGKMTWQGEGEGDVGTILVTDNAVTARPGVHP